MDLRAHRDAAPAEYEARRIHFEKVGQLFGWMTSPNQRTLLEWLPEASRAYPHHPMRIVEVGTFGGSTARGLVTMSGGGHVTCIDNFMEFHEGTLGGFPDGTAYWKATFEKNGVDLSAHAALVIGDSAVIGAAWQDPIDLLFIDGDHHFEPALDDLRLYGRHVVPGGYLLLDDYHMPEVRQAASSFFRLCAFHWDLVREPVGPDASLLILQRRPA